MCILSMLQCNFVVIFFFHDIDIVCAEHAECSLTILAYYCQTESYQFITYHKDSTN